MSFSYTPWIIMGTKQAIRLFCHTLHDPKSVAQGQWRCGVKCRWETVPQVSFVIFVDRFETAGDLLYSD